MDDGSFQDIGEGVAKTGLGLITMVVVVMVDGLEWTKGGGGRRG